MLSFKKAEAFVFWVDIANLFPSCFISRNGFGLCLKADGRNHGEAPVHLGHLIEAASSQLRIGFQVGGFFKELPGSKMRIEKVQASS